MTNQRVIDDLTALALPGRRAEMVARRLLTQGTVVDRRATATGYVGAVRVANRFEATVDIPNVQFAVPVQVGDVVHLEAINGDPLQGVYGAPVRPKGPYSLTVRSPGHLDINGWAADGMAPEAHRSVNSTFRAYVYPQASAAPTYPLVSATRVLFETPAPFIIQHPATVVGVDFHYRAAGGVQAGSTGYPLRNLYAPLVLQLLDSTGVDILPGPEGGYLFAASGTFVNTSLGLDGPPVYQNMVPRPFGGNTYRSETSVARSVHQGQRYILADTDLSAHVGEELMIRVSVPAHDVIDQAIAAGFQWRDTGVIEHAPHTHTAFGQDTSSAVVTHDPFAVPPRWRALHSDGPRGANGAQLPYTYWMGFQDVVLTLVELGTGAA